MLPVLRIKDGYPNTSPHLQDEVKLLQTELIKQGLDVGFEGADGFFGPGTLNAVIQFQQKNNIEDDGIVGPLTWSKLLNVPLPPAGTFSFATSLAKSDASLLKQLKEIENSYRDLIEQAAAAHGFQPSIIAGIGSRESHWGLLLKPTGPTGTGDFIKRGGKLPPDGLGFGRGLMQIDFDAHDFARTNAWKDPKENIYYSCKVLSDSQKMIKKNSSLKDRSLLQAAIAAYNCGPGNVLKTIDRGLDIDFFTAGRDYSKDVLSRAGWFQLQDWS